jgi:hypothetical protein
MAVDTLEYAPNRQKQQVQEGTADTIKQTPVLFFRKRLIPAEQPQLVADTRVSRGQRNRS